MHVSLLPEMKQALLLLKHFADHSNNLPLKEPKKPSLHSLIKPNGGAPAKKGTKDADSSKLEDVW